MIGVCRLTKHKGVNLTDIVQSYTDGFVQITSEHRSKLEHLWQYRYLFLPTNYDTSLDIVKHLKSKKIIFFFSLLGEAAAQGKL